MLYCFMVIWHKQIRAKGAHDENGWSGGRVGRCRKGNLWNFVWETKAAQHGSDEEIASILTSIDSAFW